MLQNKLDYPWVYVYNNDTKEEVKDYIMYNITQTIEWKGIDYKEAGGI